MQGFKETLQKQFNLSESDWEITEKYFKIEVIEPKQFFVKIGEVANKLGFVKSGILRSYTYDHEGKEVTLQFFKKGTVVIVPYSFNEGVPVNENIISYEQTELITTTSEEFSELYKKVSLWQHICKGVSEIKNDQLLDRAVQFQTNKAIDRYEEFCKCNPEILKVVPLTHIASFLGIDIATLSRLRNNKQ